MLVEVKRNGSERLATEFNTRNLNKNSDEENDEEKRVVEEVFKDIDFGLFKFSGIDFVEDLH